MSNDDNTCIVCACGESNADATGYALLQGASITTLVFVLEEGITAAEKGLCATHRKLVNVGRKMAQEGKFG